jgi:collagenase-like PrtC family protease
MDKIVRSFAIPIHWDAKYIHGLIKLNSATATIVELYGCLNTYGLPNGRIPLAHQDIPLSEAQNIRKLLKEYGLFFTYLVNGPLIEKRQFESNIIKSLQNVIDDLKPDAFVISDPKIGRAIRRINSKIPIHISSIASVETVKDFERFLDITPSRLILAHDLPKDQARLLPLLSYCKTNGVMLECMVTESCLYRCPLKSKHYTAIAAGEDDSIYHAYCLEQRLSDPQRFLEAGSFILPQDLSFYDNLGIDIYKISGRSKGASWLLKTAEAYLSGHYEGNLLDIMGISQENRNSITFEFTWNTIGNDNTGARDIPLEQK